MKKMESASLYIHHQEMLRRNADLLHDKIEMKYLNDIMAEENLEAFNKKFSVFKGEVLSLISATLKFKENILDEIEKQDNIEILYNSYITELIADDVLKKIKVVNNDDTNDIEVSALFIAIGRIPETQNFAKIIELDSNGYIVADEKCHTSKEGIFVAGDNRVKTLRQLVTATSDGAIAATEAIRYINRIG